MLKLTALFCFCLLATDVAAAKDLTLLTDEQLCLALGNAVAHKQTARLAQLEAEGERREKLKILRMTPDDCSTLSVNAVNKALAGTLAAADKKRDDAFRELEEKRKQALHATSLPAQ